MGIQFLSGFRRLQHIVIDVDKQFMLPVPGTNSGQGPDPNPLPMTRVFSTQSMLLLSLDT